MFSQVLLKCYLISIFIVTKGLPTRFKVTQSGRDFTEALMWCRRLSGQWGLPDGISHQKELLEFMLKQNLQTAWLGIKRETMGWRWVNGTKANFTSGNQYHACAVVNTGTDGSITDVPCSVEHYGFVCQLPQPDTGHCPEPHLSQSCFPLSNHWAVLGCQSKNWYDARTYCQKRGADLAILDNPEKVAIVSRHIADRKLASQCSWLYIGLHAERWIYIQPDGGSVPVNITSWGPRQPASNGLQCVELTYSTNNQADWNVVSCKSSRYTVCQNFFFVEEQHVDVKKPNITRTNEEVYKASMITVCVIAVILLVLLLVAVILILKIKKRKETKRNNTNQQVSNETESAPLLEIIPEIPKIPKINVSPQTDRITLVLYCSEATLQQSTDMTCSSTQFETETLKGHVPLNVRCIILKDNCLDKKQTSFLLKDVAENSANIDIALLPGLKFEEHTLKDVQNLQKNIVLLSFAKKGYIGDTAAETIAVGTTLSQYGLGDKDILESGLLDIICSSSEGMRMGVPLSPQLSAVISVVADKLRDVQTASIQNRTALLREHLIDLARGSKVGKVFGTHHSSTGFGEINSDAIHGRTEKHTHKGENNNQCETGNTMDAMIKVVLGSSGIQLPKEEQYAKWNVKPLDENRVGDEDMGKQTGTKAAQLLIQSLEKLGLQPNQVEIYDAHLRKHGDTADWSYFSTILQLCKEKKIDVLYITSGLGSPPPDSHELFNLLHDLKNEMVILTSSALANNIEDLYPDFPSDSVISIRRHPLGSKYARGSTVDYNFALESDGKPIWSGGVTSIALIAKILHFVDIKRENESDDGFRLTDKMHAVLGHLCKERDEDGVGILKLDIQEADIQEAVTKTREIPKYYWAGKRIPLQTNN